MLQTPRGTNDVFGSDARLFQRVEETFRRLARAFGFHEIRTPCFEFAEVFERGVGEASDVVAKQMYVFDDRGGRRLALRPEGTAACVRAYLQHNLHKNEPYVKWFYIGPMFRYEKPQKGRERQFHQLGAEVFGLHLPETDAELMQLLVRTVGELSPSRVKLLVNSVGCRACRPAYERLLGERLLPEADHLCGDCRRRLKRAPLRVFDCKNARCRELFASLPVPLDHLCQDCAAYHEQTLQLLARYELPHEVTPRLVRGLDYYTHVTFELVGEEVAGAALGGGGRYDDLVETLGGPSVPASGFAAGVERIVLWLRAGGADTDGKLDAILLPLSRTETAEAFALASQLRAEGVRADVDPREAGVGSRTKRAAKQAFFGLFLGAEEVRAGEVTIKDFRQGRQRRLPRGEVAAFLQRELA